MVIKPIPTEYKGIVFKSKLEANWAEWLDRVDIKWNYETHGFDVNGTWYLPDFYLYEVNTIIEVKGIRERIEKPYQLMKEIEREKGVYNPDEELMILLAGPVIPYFYNIFPTYSYGFYVNKCSCGVNSIVTKMMSYKCRVCGKHDGMHGIRRNGVISIDVGVKPLEWLYLEE